MLLSALEDRRDRPTGRLLVLCDVTERKRVDELELVHQKAQLAHANAELEHFAYLIAHDLRSPMRSIDGFSRVLIEDYEGDLDEEGLGYLNRVRDSTGRMARMIDDLLDLARLTRTTLRRERVDLGALAEDVVADLREGQPERGVEFTGAEGLLGEGDPRLLRIALANLLENVWKFTGKTPEAKIAFSAEQRNGETVYFVRDNGVGIGLAAVARVIERHGGEVWTDSAVDKGAASYFTS